MEEVWLQIEAHITEEDKSEYVGLPWLINAWINISYSANEATLIFALYKMERVGVEGTSACQRKKGMIAQ